MLCVQRPGNANQPRPPATLAKYNFAGKCVPKYNLGTRKLGTHKRSVASKVPL